MPRAGPPGCGGACRFAQWLLFFIYSISHRFRKIFSLFLPRKAAGSAGFSGCLRAFCIETLFLFPEKFFDKSFRQNAEIHCFPRIFAQIFFFNFVQFV